jgi:predicted N-acetyltransferase YhbS
MNLNLRTGRVADSKTCGAICYEAFRTISQAHNFPPDIPSPELAERFLSWMLAHEQFYKVVAEVDGTIVGSNFLDERNAIYGIGPITVDPTRQNKSVGRRLMDAVMARVISQKAPGVRLVQPAFHNRSLSLYSTLGFDVREPLACMQGPALALNPAGRTVRFAVENDLDRCNEVCCA